MARLQADVKDAALSHIQSLQTLVDAKVQMLTAQTEQAIEQALAGINAQKQSSIQAITDEHALLSQ